jgi:inositol transport system ATP-binding protein
MLLSMVDVSKRFPGVLALDGASLAVARGTVHALLGENGAGKSTLMRILIGLYQPDSGSVRFRGETVVHRSVADALARGISMIHQELYPVREMTVAENIFLGREPVRGPASWVDEPRMVREARVLFEELEVDIDPAVRMRELSVARTQMVEIAKALSLSSDLIIMDEPTSAITSKEAAQLFRIIRALKERGVAIIYISHKMDEVFAIADEFTVLRDGRTVGSGAIAGVDQDRLIEMMVGRSLDQIFPKETAAIGDVVLDVSGLTRRPAFEDVSFAVRAGEILGIAGLVGSGRTEVVESIFGVVPPDSGSVTVRGRRLDPPAPRAAIDCGLAFLTEDRKLTGLFLAHDVRANMGIAALDRHVRRSGLIDPATLDAAVEDQMSSLAIRSRGPSEPIANLSGGNQQKVLIGRWLMTRPAVLILDEPTRGIDVGAKAEVHRVMTRLVQSGMAVVMISSEMPEILGMSDRILVMHRGRVAAELVRAEATQETIMRHAMGLALAREPGGLARADG